MSHTSATLRAARCRALASVLSLLAVAGCSSPVELVGEGRVGTRRAAITGGVVYTGHPAVGRLTNGGSGQCTATLVGERTVLTAAHCIDDGAIEFLLDSGQRIAAVKAVRHPEWQGDGADHDIAVVQLARPPGVLPVAVSVQAPKVGMPIVLIGYGVTMCEEIPGTNPMQLSCTNDANIKRLAENTVAALQGGIEFTYEGRGSTCKGDSGGPAFATIDGREVLLGVTSRGTMPCGTRGVDTRVDAFVEWINQTAAGDLNTGQGPAVRITAPADKTTLPAGPLTVLAEIGEGAGRVVSAELLLDGAVVATTSTAPFSFAVEVSPGAHELTVVAEDPMGNRGDSSVAVTAVSEPAVVGAGAFGSECSGPEDCDSGLCARDGETGQAYCTAGCEPGKGDACPSSSDCLPTAQGQHVCALQPFSGAPADAEALLVGGCRLGAGASQGTALPALLLVLLALARTRRRR